MTYLTPRGVRTMLTRRGVDHSELTITATVNAHEVLIEGPKPARRAATKALALGYENTIPGMWTAPYSDHDLLIRR